MRNSRNVRPYVNTGKRSAALKLTAVLVIAAVLIYLAGSATAGSFISEKIIDPVLDFISPKNTEYPMPTYSDASPADTPLPGKTDFSKSDSSETFLDTSNSATVTVPEDEIYMLVCGTYPDKDSADKAATEAAGKGGAGYVLCEADTYSVILAAYGNSKDAGNVASRLSGMSVDIKKAVSQAVMFDISADEEVTDTISELSDVAPEYPEKFYELAVSLDKGEADYSSVISDLKNMQKEASEYETRLKIWSGAVSDSTIEAFLNYITAVRTEAETAAKQKTELELSSRLKYAYIACFLAEAKTAETINS